MPDNENKPPEPNQIQAAAYASFIPAGAIVAFAGESNRIPSGWQLCDGREVSKYEPMYHRLFEAIVTAWGGTGTPRFFLPDLRGMFLRGVSGSSGRDPDRDTREAPRHGFSTTNPGNKGNEVGSVQDDANKTHEHVVGPLSLGRPKPGSNSADVVAIAQGETHSDHDKTHKALQTGAHESRPKNAYVHYIIKL